MDMFRHMLENNQQVQDEFENWKISNGKYKKFIEELIMGEPGENAERVSTLLCLFKYAFLANCSAHLYIFTYRR